MASRQYYHPFGDNRNGPFSTLTTKRFTGQYHEEALGLYFYGARWYDPALGRFTQADTAPSRPPPQAGEGPRPGRAPGLQPLRVYAE